jgi:DNA-binding NarL/FixJ family response regulator
MSGIGTINLKVLILDTDYYALQAINGYLAWDRRTRVTYMAETVALMWQHINNMPAAELPDVVLLDADHLGGARGLQQQITKLRAAINNVCVICLAQVISPELVEAAADAGARAYLLKQEVRLQIAGTIVYIQGHDFVVSRSVASECASLFNTRVFHARILPERREYPELTDRIRQAIKLCVVEGMPAHLAADEMGISLHTIRGYVKDGYRILETYDDTDYPIDLTPQERAFMRFTALDTRSERGSSQPA